MIFSCIRCAGYFKSLILSNKLKNLDRIEIIELIKTKDSGYIIKLSFEVQVHVLKAAKSRASPV